MTREEVDAFVAVELDEEALKMWNLNRIDMSTVGEIRRAWD